jgi:DNA-binding NtrC family response regulator
MSTINDIIAKIHETRSSAQQKEIELIYQLSKHVTMVQVATLLKIDRKTLYNKLKRYQNEQRNRS